jgi:hypothetical protein
VKCYIERETLFKGVVIIIKGPGSSVGIVTGYGLDGPGIEIKNITKKNLGVGAIFRTRPGRPWIPLSVLYNGYRIFPGGKAVGAWFWPPTPF